MDQLTRIEKLLERIAVVLEKHGEPKLDWPSFDPARWPIPNPKDWQWTGPTADAVSDRWLDTQKPYDTEIKYSTDTTHLRQRFGVDYSMMGDGDG